MAQKRKNLFADDAAERVSEQESIKEKVTGEETVKKQKTAPMEEAGDSLGLSEKKARQRGMAMTIYIRPDDKNLLKKYADTHGVSCSEVISRMINRYCAE